MCVLRQAPVWHTFAVAVAGGHSGVIGIIGDQVVSIGHGGHSQVTLWDYIIGLQNCGVVIWDQV